MNRGNSGVWLSEKLLMTKGFFFFFANQRWKMGNCGIYERSLVHDQLRFY